MHINQYSLYVCLFLWIYNPVCGEAAHVCTLPSPVYLTDVADDMNNMPCTLTKIDTMIFFALHLCLLCWHGNPVVWSSSPHYEQCQLCYWYFELTLYFLIWNWMELTAQLSSLFIHVQNLSSLCFVSGWYAWWHAQVCWRLWDKPNIYCSKEGKTSWR